MKVKFTYFKASGKFYANGEGEFPDTDFWSFIDVVKDMQQRQETFPGLIGTWNLPILVEKEDWPPHLVDCVDRDC